MMPPKSYDLSELHGGHQRLGHVSDAHVVQCEHPRNTYTTNLPWIDVGAYTFRVAPGNPNGPYTRPIAVLHSLAQTTVFGVAQ
jgi:hypothetical protein